MIQKILFLFSLCMVQIELDAQNPILDWAKSINGSSYENVNSTAVDALGNVYATGHFQGTVDFDPGPGTYAVTSAGNSDIFLLKLDAFGNFLWVNTFGDQLYDRSNAITIDISGNILIAGIYTWIVDFDPGVGVFNLTSGSQGSIFVCKYNQLGDLIWAADMGSNQIDDEALGITTDASGNVYTTGYFSGTADFDPGPGTYTITAATPPGYVGVDIFVSKLSASGNFIWASEIGGKQMDRATSIAVDNSNNVYITGYFADTCDFAPGPFVSNLISDGANNAFVCKLSTSGNYIWARKLSSTSVIMGMAVGVDAGGNVYSTGYFDGTADFDPAATNYFQAAIGNEDMYISKLNGSGDFVWAKIINSTGGDQGKALSIGSSGNIYTTGIIGGTADFDPGPSTYTLSNPGAFVSILNPSGNFVNAIKVGTGGASSGSSIKLDSQGNIYTGGFYTLGTIDFDPGAGIFNLACSGATDGFVHKVHVCYNTSSTYSINVCDSYTSPSGAYTFTNSGVYLDTIGNALGCDSVITINLTINHPSFATITPSVCNTYTSPSGVHTWSTSGTYTDVIPNALGCDSVITINLTVNHPSFAIITPSVCNTYTSPSGVQTWSASGTYTDVITNVLGCDSIITINLTITSIDTGIVNNGITLTSNAIGSSYQWLNCNAGLSQISGEINQTFNATANGYYAVQITQNTCVDTSSCIMINVLDMENKDADTIFKCYPNPTTGQLLIETNLVVPNALIHITDVLGKIVYSAKMSSSNIISIQLEGDPGLYVVEIITGKNNPIRVKVLKH